MSGVQISQGMLSSHVLSFEVVTDLRKLWSCQQRDPKVGHSMLTVRDGIGSISKM